MTLRLPLAKACVETAVDLTWTYSNQQDLADLLRRARVWLSEDHQESVQDRQTSVRAKPNSAVPRRVVDRLGEAAVQEIIEVRQAGMKLTDVAKLFGISESSVKRLARADRVGTQVAVKKRHADG